MAAATPYAIDAGARIEARATRVNNAFLSVVRKLHGGLLIVRGVAHLSAACGAAEHREPVPIDHHVLARLLCNDRDAEKEVLRAFLAAWPNDLEGLCRALDGPERAAAMRLAHRMKGACRIVGANPLAEACERAERVLSGGDVALVEGAMSELSRETARAADYLREWLGRSG